MKMAKMAARLRYKLPGGSAAMGESFVWKVSGTALLCPGPHTPVKPSLKFVILQLLVPSEGRPLSQEWSPGMSTSITASP